MQALAVNDPEVPEHPGLAASSPVLMAGIGGTLHGVVITAADAEIEHHILDCQRHNERAYRSYQATGNVHERRTALCWIRLMADAIRARRPEIVRALEAEAWERVQQGVGYFSSRHAVALGEGK